MADVREQILARLSAILSTMPAVIMGEPAVFATRARNRGELEKVQRPALVLLDGEERVGDAYVGTNRPSNAPRLVVMSPQIAIIIGDREPQNVMIGEDLNAMRVAIIKAVATDAELLALVGSNGAVQYAGLVSDLSWSASLQGVMVLQFAVTYVLKISQI